MNKGKEMDRHILKKKKTRMRERRREADEKKT